jgi:hypothetical protein
MVKSNTNIKFMVGHALAGAVVILGTLLVAAIGYIMGLASAPKGSAGSVIPGFFKLMFTASVVAVIVAATSFLTSVFLMWFRTKRHFPLWLPVLIVPPLACFVALFFGDLEFVATMTSASFIYFGIYWALLLSSSALLDFLRERRLRSS